MVMEEPASDETRSALDSTPNLPSAVPSVNALQQSSSMFRTTGQISPQPQEPPASRGVVPPPAPQASIPSAQEPGVWYPVSPSPATSAPTAVPSLVMPGRAKVTSGKPVTSMIYPIHRFSELFTLDEFQQFLQKRLDMENLDDPYQVFMTRKNAMIIIGTDDLHTAIKKIMTEIDDIVSSEEYEQLSQSSGETIKVIPLKNSEGGTIMSACSNLFRDSNVILCCDQLSNQILLKGKQGDCKVIEELIQKLDVKPIAPAAMSGGGMGGMGSGGSMGSGLVGGSLHIAN